MMHGLTTAKQRSTIGTMQHLRFPMSIRYWVMGLHAVLLAAILAVPGSGVLCQLYSLFNRTSEGPSVASSQHPTRERVNVAHLRLASSCHEDHEYRLTTPHRPPLFSKSRQAAVPLQTFSACGRGVSQANIASLTFAGPAPPLFSPSPSRAPPLTPSRV